jgi:hypothetical protein
VANSKTVASDDAVLAIRAWMRLDQAIAGFNRELERRHGVTGAQLAILRIVAEWQPRSGLPSCCNGW